MSCFCESGSCLICDPGGLQSSIDRMVFFGSPDPVLCPLAAQEPLTLESLQAAFRLVPDVPRITLTCRPEDHQLLVYRIGRAAAPDRLADPPLGVLGAAQIRHSDALRPGQAIGIVERRDAPAEVFTFSLNAS